MMHYPESPKVTLMGPTVTRPVQDPLAITLLDNRLSISVLKLLLFCFFLSYLFFTLDHVIKIILFSFFILIFFSIFLCVCIYPFPSPSLFFSYVKIILKRRIYYYGKTETFLTFAPPRKKNKKEEICENRMWHVKMFYLSMNDHSNSNNAKLGSSTINFFSYSYSTMYLWQVWFRWKITFTLA